MLSPAFMLFGAVGQPLPDSTGSASHILYWLIGFFAFWIILLTLVARFEQRMVWPYGPLQKDPPFGDPSGYGARLVKEALQAGFVLFGWAPDLKGATYRVSYAFLLSPDCDCLAVVGVGSILKRPLRGVWLHTLALDGQRSFYTTNNQDCVEIDVARNRLSQLAFATNFGDLWRKHREWMEEAGVAFRQIHRDKAIEEFRAVCAEHYRLLAQFGFISFTDASATHWRYTIYGAIKWAVLNYSIGMLRALSFGKLPKIA